MTGNRTVINIIVVLTAPLWGPYFLWDRYLNPRRTRNLGK